ncbi:DUF3558 domain-containing protein [Allokutzneria oryzae]|uniref:DUF3558 domain-containing protein n=1 Tax=Allokutzneria oryzae TaxID=1378989 RepID=A0ABV5ZUQ8_9PSEU
MRPRVLVIAAAMLAITGCSQQMVGQPETLPPQSPDSSVAPPIPQPHLSFERFLSRPCDVLTREQLAAIGITRDPGKVDTSPVGNRCLWQADETTDTAVSVTLMTSSAGLDGAYRNRNRGYFSETQIGDYPAAHADNKKPVGRTTPSGDCETVVGVAPSVAYRAGARAYRPNPDYEQPCKASDRVALWVLEKLKVPN